MLMIDAEKLLENLVEQMCQIDREGTVLMFDDKHDMATKLVNSIETAIELTEVVEVEDEDGYTRITDTLHRVRAT